jgi:hypothetical protein
MRFRWSHVDSGSLRGVDGGMIKEPVLRLDDTARAAAAKRCAKMAAGEGNYSNEWLQEIYAIQRVGRVRIQDVVIDRLAEMRRQK